MAVSIHTKNKCLFAYLRMLLIIFVGVNFLSVPTAYSDPATPVHEVNLAAALLQVGLALVVIVALILGSAWLARRFKIAGIGHEQHIKAVSVLPVGRKEKIMLIESCGQKLLVGVASNNINTLHVFDENNGEQGVDTHKNREEKVHLGEVEGQLDQSGTVGEAIKQNPSVSAQTIARATSRPTSTKEFSHFLKAVLSGKKYESGNEH